MQLLLSPLIMNRNPKDLKDSQQISSPKSGDEMKLAANASSFLGQAQISSSSSSSQQQQQQPNASSLSNAALLELISQEQRRNLLASLQLSSLPSTASAAASSSTGNQMDDTLRALLLQQRLAQQQAGMFGAAAGFGGLGFGLGGGFGFNTGSPILPNPSGLAELLAQQQQQQQQQSQLMASLLNPNFQQSHAILTSSSSGGGGGEKRKGRTGAFPQKLHQLLLDLEEIEGGTDIAAFLPHGRAFAIHDPKEFCKTVMPKYFRMNRFSSFQRQLNLYEFQRVTEGPNKGSYYHELFVKGNPTLCTHIKRNKIKSENPSNKVRDPFGPLGPGITAAAGGAGVMFPPVANQSTSQSAANLSAVALLQSLARQQQQQGRGGGM